MSLETRSPLHRVNDQVRMRQKTRQRQTFCDLGMFMSSTLQASVFIGNIPLKKHEEDLTMKQMFDICEKLITQQSDEIYGVNTTNWEDSSWKNISLAGDESLQSLAHKGLRIFRFCIMLWKEERPTIKLCVGGLVDVV